MPELTERQHQMLENLAVRNGVGPDRPYLNDDGRTLMRLGLIELIDPPQAPGRAKGMPYCQLTPTGWRVAAERPNWPAKAEG